MRKREALYAQFEKAFFRLKEVMALEKTAITRDSAIKRFEITLDLAWKLLKTYLQEEKGILLHSPKEAFRQGYGTGLLSYQEEWLTLVDLRNEAVHSYSEEFAEKVYAYIDKALHLFSELLEALKA